MTRQSDKRVTDPIERLNREVGEQKTGKQEADTEMRMQQIIQIDVGE